MKQPDSPPPCPHCGSRSMLFTPNARRNPYEEPPLYEAAWQCTTCGHLEFIAPPGRRDSPDRTEA